CPADPAALVEDGKFSHTVGSVLDPCLSIRRVITLAPDGVARLIAALAAHRDRDRVLESLSRRAITSAPATFSAAPQCDNKRLAAAGLTAAERRRLPWLTGALAYGLARPGFNVPLPAASRVLPADLKSIGLSGQLPLLVARIATKGESATATTLARAARY